MNPKQISDMATGINALMNESIEVIGDTFFFDKSGFDDRLDDYVDLLGDESNSISSICNKLEITFDIFKVEVCVVATFMPVCLKFIDSEIKIDIQKQKQLDAVGHIRDKFGELSIELLCEHLYVDVKTANSIVERENLTIDGLPSFENYVESDFLADIDTQKKVINWFNQHPYAKPIDAAKALDIPINQRVLRSGIRTLIDNGHKIPCITDMSPLHIEKQKADIIEFKMKNPYATPVSIAKTFNVDPKLVRNAIDEVSEQWRQEKRRSHEFHFKRILDELTEIKDGAMRRFNNSDKSSSKWLEVALIGVEKEVKMLGLNAPTELNIQQDVNVHSKEEKDAVIEAYFATDDFSGEMKKIDE